jgi:hypothetical protein
VPTKPIPIVAAVRILGGHHVSAFEASPAGWQGAPQLERGAEKARRRRGCGAAPRSVSGEINSTQELARRRPIEVIETGTGRPRTLSLFPEDRCDGLLPDSSIVRLKL